MIVLNRRKIIRRKISLQKIAGELKTPPVVVNNVFKLAVRFVTQHFQKGILDQIQVFVPIKGKILSSLLKNPIKTIKIIHRKNLAHALNIDQEEKLINLVSTYNQIKDFTGVSVQNISKNLPLKKSYSISIDLSGWEYLDLLQEHTIDFRTQTIKGRDLIVFMDMSSASGKNNAEFVFSDQLAFHIYPKVFSRNIFDALSSSRGYKAYLSYLSKLRETIEHEARHLSQFLVRNYSRNITDFGEAPGKLPSGGDEYFFHKDEFSPWISSTAEAIMRVLDNLPERIWPLAIAYILRGRKGEGWKSFPRKDISDFLKYLRHMEVENPNYILSKPTEFLKKIKKVNPSLYKRAVREIYKRLQREGYAK